MRKFIRTISVAAFLAGSMLLASCGGSLSTTSNAVSMPAPPPADESFEYVAPAETPATWSAFDEDASWSDTDPLICLTAEMQQTQWKGAKLYGNDLYIKEAGTYILSGNLEGQLYVAVNQEDKVHLVFNGFHVTCGSLSPILCERGDKVSITLVDGTENTVNDTASGYLAGSATADGRNAGAIHAKMGLTINGTGTLRIKTTYRHGIVCNSNLRILSGSIFVEAEDQGIKGKESVSVRGGTVSIHSKGDGIKVNDEVKEDAGYFAMEGGSISVQTDADGIDVTKLVRIVGGELKIDSKDHGITTTGTFSTAASPMITLDAYSGAEDSDAKGIKADGEIAVDGGTIRILRAFEGIESKNSSVVIKNGTVEIDSANDGVNAGTLLTVEGGILYVKSQGDCLDSGGDIHIKGGKVVLAGSSSNAYAPMDVPEGHQILVDGGFLLAYGSLAEVQYPSSASAQGVICATETIEKGASCAIKDADGTVLCVFTARDTALTLCFSSEKVQKGTSYTIYTDVTPLGDPQDGVYDKCVSGQAKQTLSAQ